MKKQYTTPQLTNCYEVTMSKELLLGVSGEYGGGECEAKKRKFTNFADEIDLNATLEQEALNF